MSCNDKISDRCLNKVNAKCVNYEGTLAENTKISQNSCLDLETVVEDLNAQVNDLYKTSDVSILSNDTCIDYPVQNPYGKVTSKTAIITLNTKVKELMDFVGLGCDGSSGDCPEIFFKDITCLNLDFGVLADPCGQKPSTLKDVIQLILNHLQN